MGLNAEIAKPTSLLAHIQICTEHVRSVPNSASAMSVLLNRSGIRRNLFGVVYCGPHALTVSIVVSAILVGKMTEILVELVSIISFRKTEYMPKKRNSRLLIFIGDEDSISGNLGSNLAEYNTAMGSPDLDNSLIALEAAISGGSGIVDRDDAVYDVQLTNNNSSSTIHTGDNIRVGTSTTVESK